ncbi:MAG: hypothetical protein IJE68_03275 [Clostridia bacterium]|nr:hypothetical protein [Clostridia bacterium]
MEKNQRNPRKRLNSLILLVAFTAVMLIVSTYAWFSAQKTVTVGNLEGKVNVAEGIEISLDAVNWSQEIDFSDYHVTDGDVGEYTGLVKTYGDNNHNILPTELIPVSTTGTQTIDTATLAAAGDARETANDGHEIEFFNGQNYESIKLKEIIAVDPQESSSAQTDFAGYYAIDLFLRNSSKLDDPDDQGVEKETLQLNTNSNLQLVSGGSATTGLQNTVRVALALYEPDTSTGGSVAVTETDQDKILTALTGAAAEISDVAIWEPNADQHVTEILTNNNKITWSDADADLYLTTTVEDKTGSDRLDLTSGAGKKVQAGEMTPTYALLKAAVGTTIDNIYDWSGTNSSKLKKQIALQTKYSATAGNYTTVDGGVRNLISSKTSTGADVYEYGTATAVTSTGVEAETGAQEFQIYKNQISRVRMYVWLEGQDIDCTNYASHGAGIHLDLGLVKGAIVGGMADS